MMKEIVIQTQGEKFYSITELVQSELTQILKESGSSSGMLFLQCAHTSCGLCISESFDPNAKEDLESFLKHLAPRNLSFIKHDSEGPDDSPSHNLLKL
jgi:secondary thiamine-phosphate synthase enzyme